MGHYQRILNLDNTGFARVPFSLAAVAILLISTLTAGHVYQIVKLNTDSDLEHRQDLINAAAVKASSQFEITAYNSLQNVLDDLESIIELEDVSLNEKLEAECGSRLAALYPLITEDYIVDIEGFFILVVEDWTKEETDLTANSLASSRPAVQLYLKLTGSITYQISFRHSDGLAARQSSDFIRHVPVPLPLVVNKISIFKSQSSGSYSDLARLTNYILTTAVQLRVLSGKGNDTLLPALMLTEDDVEVAVNLAVLLEQARLFRTYDPLVAKSLGLEGQFESYLSTGQIDGSDLFFALESISDDKIDIGKMIAASIESFADEFVYRLLETFWPGMPPDAVMQEPNLNWSVLQAEGEDYAREKLEEWLGCFKKWLLIPPVLFNHIGSATIPTIRRHATSVDEASKYPIPLPVRGYYKLFSMPYPAKWFVFTGGLHTDPDVWPPLELTKDPVQLILGESEDPKFRPKPFEISFMSTFGLPRSIKYYPVHRSFISLYAEPGSETPYFDTLKVLLETLRAGVTIRSGAGGQSTTDERFGMLDLMAQDAELVVDTLNPDLHWRDVDNNLAEPNDGIPVLEEAPAALLEGPVTDALNAFRGLARAEELSSTVPGSGSWYEIGLLKKQAGSRNGLYDLFVDTVDLYYELYSTLKKSSDGKVGKLDGNWAWNFPEIYFAPLEGVQEKKNKNDSFNFKRDAVKHAYNNVWMVVTIHLIPNRLFFKPDAISPGKFECASPSIPIVAWEAYGWDKYPWDLSGPNLHLWDDIHNALKDALENAFGPKLGIRLEVDLGLKVLDLFTDKREYGSAFHEFLWLYIGREIFNPAGAKPEGTLESLVRPGKGSLETLLLDKLPGGISSYADTYNLIETRELELDEPFGFNKIYRRGEVSEDYEFTEAFDLAQYPPRLKAGSDLSIIISEVHREPRFVSVQERTSSLSDAPFVTSWTVSVEGEFKLAVKSDRNCLIDSGGYRPLSLNESIRLYFELEITTFSGWPLGGSRYPMTREALSELGDRLPVYSDISVNIQKLLNLELAAESELMERFQTSADIIAGHTQGPLSKQAGSLSATDNLEAQLVKLTEPLDTNRVLELRLQFDEFNDLIEDPDPVQFNFSYYGNRRTFERNSISSLQVSQNYMEDKSGIEIEIDFNENFPEISLHYETNLISLVLTNKGLVSNSAGRLDLNAETSRFEISIGIDDSNNINPSGTLLLSIFEQRALPSGAVINTIQTDIKLEPSGLVDRFSKIIDPIVTDQKICSDIFEASKLNSKLLYILENLLEGTNEFIADTISIKFNFEIIRKEEPQDFISLEIKDIEELELVVDYIRTFRTVQYEMLTYLSGANGGSIVNLAPALFLELGANGLNPSGITVTIYQIDGQQELVSINKATLDRFYGPDEIRTAQTGSFEMVCLQLRKSRTSYQLNYQIK